MSDPDEMPALRPELLAPPDLQRLAPFASMDHASNVAVQLASHRRRLSLHQSR